MADKVRIAVVFGGRSAEHAISCVSAGSVIAALDPARYEVVPIGIAADGRWVLADRIQRLLEMAGVPYVGSGVFASAASMDKEYTKKLLAAAGLPQGDHVVLRDPAGALSADPGALDPAARERLGLPVFVKPSRAGSSIGITKVTDWAKFPGAVATAAAVDPKVVVEAA